VSNDNKPVRSKDRFIVFGSPLIGDREVEEVVASIKSGWLGTGPKVAQFEQDMKTYPNAKYAVAVNSCTAALHLSILAAGIKPGDEVITTPLTFCATVNAIIHSGGTPVLADVDPSTMNIDPKQVKEKITPRTKAIVPVHFAGYPCDMDELCAIAAQNDLKIIEDCAHAIETEYKGRKVGTFGDFGCLSFYVTKNVVTGEGGMVVTDNEEHAARLKVLALHGISEERHFWHQYVGFNYRMTNVQAAIGLAQVEIFDELVGARIRHAQQYNAQLGHVPGLRLPPEPPGLPNVYWMYGLVVEDGFGMTRDELRNALAARGVETRTFFVPMHCQPIYFRKYQGQRYPVAEDLCRRGLYLPSSSSLSEQQIDYVGQQIREVRP